MDNVLIDDNGHIVITNFGSAVQFGAENEDYLRTDLPKGSTATNSLRADADTTTHIAGKPGFMAPEILGEECHSYGVDIFSMGVIAHVLVYGQVSSRSSSLIFRC